MVGQFRNEMERVGMALAQAGAVVGQIRRDVATVAATIRAWPVTSAIIAVVIGYHAGRVLGVPEQNARRIQSQED
jgi:hypothetical protein